MKDQMQPTHPAPRVFWRVTFWTPDGVERRRYIRCPYLVPSDEGHGGKAYRRPLAPGDPDYPDTVIAMTAALGALAFDGVIASYRVTPVPSERVTAIRQRSIRWREALSAIAA